MVVFTMAVTDFGIPKVIGGNFNVLAVDIYKQVIGQQNFSDGRRRRPGAAAAGGGGVRRRQGGAAAQQALLTARSVPYQARPARARDFALLMLGFVLMSAR